MPPQKHTANDQKQTDNDQKHIANDQRHTDNDQRPPAGDQAMSKVIGNLLRYGVLTSSCLVLAGGILYLFRHGSQLPHYRQFISGGSSMSDPGRLMAEPGSLWKGMWQGRGRAIIGIGLLVLIATPVMRIAASVIGYVLEKDRLYVLLTTVVLGVILCGLLGVI